MLDFNFISADYSQSLEKLALWLGNRPRNHIISFDEFTGTGTVFLQELEEGLFIRVWNFLLNEETRFNLKAVADDEPVLFTVNYLLSPETYLIETCDSQGKPALQANSLQNILFSSNKSEFVFIVKAHKPARSFEICFTGDWLHRHFPATEDKSKQLLAITLPGKPYFMQPLSLNDFNNISDLLDKVSEQEWSKISLRSRVFALLDDLFYNFFNRDTIGIAGLPPYVEVMIKVEKYIKSFLYGRLPDLEEVARNFSLSQSTLKRQFKSVYTRNIYEYYLHQKMQLAKQMLLDKKMTISQVAYALGYEKLSSFSGSFKKHFGKSPASIRNEPQG